MRLHLNIGSNSDKRRTRIREALAAVSLYFSRCGGRTAYSAPVCSEPWGFDSPNEFLNIGVMADLPGPATAERVLNIFRDIQKIERSISDAPHRNADGSYRDREIDIDLITAGIRLDTPELQLPHPLASERQFVTGPMRELEGADVL